MADLDITATDHLTPEQAARVTDLSGRAADADGVGALSEDSRLALAGTGPRRHHLLTYAGADLAGYLTAEVGPGPAVEVVVDPDHRRTGIGGALWQRLGEPDARVWAHGRLPAAEAFAASHGLNPVRELLKMARALQPEDASNGAATSLPPGFTARAFVPGDDDVAVEAVNAAAFAHHPEQGQMGLAGLRARMAEPWFDPEGLIVVEDTTDPADRATTADPADPADPARENRPAVAAFHWTKVDPPADAGGTVGEVYVVGVAPAYQGRGLARPLTALGLAHLSRLGLTSVELYVDGDNAPARATYARAGFETIMVDVMYSRSVHPSVEA